MKYDNELFLLSEFFSHNTINKKDSREISDKKRGTPRLSAIIPTNQRRYCSREL